MEGVSMQVSDFINLGGMGLFAWVVYSEVKALRTGLADMATKISEAGEKILGAITAETAARTAASQRTAELFGRLDARVDELLAAQRREQAPTDPIRPARRDDIVEERHELRYASGDGEARLGD
jgi:hypothetical protein